MRKFISIYRSSKKEGMYLYLEKEHGLKKVPEALLKLFGKPALVTHMIVDKDKKFARFDSTNLFKALLEKGFYLQMPDPLPEYRQFMVKSNQRLDVESQ
jgi:uncharacterized protein YcgL (UPF0745 family)